jgi:hypothetical protein
MRRFWGAILACALCAGMSWAAQKPLTLKATTQKLIVYYFHNSARCYTCRKFESLTKDIMETRFAEDVKKGRVEYQVVNVDDSGNEHFIKDYSLFSKSVILSDTKDGKQNRWKNLDKIWEKVRNEDAYREYIETEVRSYLKGA